MSVHAMTVSVVCAAFAAALGSEGVRAWRHRRRLLAALCAAGAAACALVAVRDLPEPVVVALLLAGLGVVAVITAWPLVADGRGGGDGRVEPGTGADR